MSGARAIHPLWGVAEVAVLAGLFLSGLWFVGPRVGVDPAATPIYWTMIAVAVVILVASPFVIHKLPPETAGWSFKAARDDPGAIRYAWPYYAAFTVAAAMLLILIAWWRDPGFVTKVNWTTFAIKLVGYIFSGLLQAFVFFGVMLNRFRTAIPKTPAAPWRHQAAVAVATTVVFSGLHFPNWQVMTLCAGCGLGWSLIFYARPNVLLLGLSHAALGTLTHQLVGLSTRIGPFYWHPDHYVVRNAIPWIKAVIADRY
jgi:hypothetical protein